MCFCFREQQEGMIKPQDFLTIDPILPNPWKSPRVLMGNGVKAQFSKIKACLRVNAGGSVVCVWSKGRSQRGTPCGWAQWHHPYLHFSADQVFNLQPTVISRFQGTMRHVETLFSCTHLAGIYINRRKCRAVTNNLEHRWEETLRSVAWLQDAESGSLAVY